MERSLSPILTFVVPSYKTASFLSRSLEPFLSPNLAPYIQVFLVDDGSPDVDTPRALRAWAQKYPSLFSYFRKDDHGHGSTINYSISRIKTKFFKVIDGDDWIDPKETEALVHFLISCEDDLVVTDYAIFDEKSEKTRIIKAPKNANSLACGNMPIDSINGYTLCFHNTLFSTALWSNNQIHIREDVFYDDQEYFQFPLVYVHSFSYFPATVYQYRIGSNEQSVSISAFTKRYPQLLLVCGDIFENFANNITKIPNRLSEELMNYACALSSIAVHTLLKINVSNKEKRNALLEFDGLLRKYPKISEEFEKRSRLLKALRKANFHCLALFRLIGK